MEGRFVAFGSEIATDRAGTKVVVTDIGESSSRIRYEKGPNALELHAEYQLEATKPIALIAMPHSLPWQNGDVSRNEELQTELQKDLAEALRALGHNVAVRFVADPQQSVFASSH